VWDLQTGRTRVVIRLPRSEATNPFAIFADASFSSDGKRIVTAQFNKLVHLWDAATGQLVRSLPHSGIVYSSAFSHDGRLVIGAGGDGTAQVWNADTGDVHHVLRSPSGQLRDAAFSADGSRVVAATADGSVVVWDLGSERVLAVLRRHAGLVNTAVFRPTTDDQLLTGSDDQTARLFVCESCGSLAELVSLARQRERLTQGGT
jgi:WD40 repeat protein